MQWCHLINENFYNNLCSVNNIIIKSNIYLNMLIIWVHLISLSVVWMIDARGLCQTVPRCVWWIIDNCDGKVNYDAYTVKFKTTLEHFEQYYQSLQCINTLQTVIHHTEIHYTYQLYNQTNNYKTTDKEIKWTQIINILIQLLDFNDNIIYNT